MMVRKRPFLPVMLGAFALMGAGCTAAFLDTSAHGIFTQEEINLNEKNYAAADYLIQQAKSYIGPYASIQAAPLTDIVQPEMVSTFAKMVPEQIGVRLSQLGYRVNLERVALGEDTNYLRPSDAVINKKPDLVLAGSFMRGRSDMDVSVRLVDPRNNQVVGVYDYKLPLTREIADLAKPKPKIMRVP